MSATAPSHGAAGGDRLLARAVLYRALKIGLDRPTEAVARAFFDRQGSTALRLAARMLDDGGTGALEAALDRLEELPAPELKELRRSHEALFGHTLRGRVCPYECEYGHRPLLQQAHELADLAGFYAAFGLGARKTRHERPDHVACQLEFLDFLTRKERWALEHGDGEMAEVTRAAARRLLAEHLTRFGRAFAVSLQQAAPDSFYGFVGELCEAVLRLDCGRLDLPLGPEVLELRSTAADGVPMACGADGDDELVQLGGAPPGARRTGST